MNAQGTGPAREWSLITAMLALAVLPPAAVLVALFVAVSAWGEQSDAMMPVVFLLIAVFGAAAASRRLPGRAVRPPDEPQLAALVQDVAERLGFREPLLVRVVPDVHAALHRAKVSGIRAYVLVLGLPLLRALTADQLAAVVAHELAHEQHVSHRRTAWLLRSRRLLEVCLAPRLRPLAPLSAPLLRATQPRAWRTETDADADAARIAGTRATTTALERTVLLDAVYRSLGRRWWSALAQDGSYPQDFYDALDTAATDPHVAHRAARVAAERESVDPYATADHPPTAARLTALRDTAPPAVTSYGEEPIPLRTAEALERWCVEQLLAQHTARGRNRRPKRATAGASSSRSPKPGKTEPSSRHPKLGETDQPRPLSVLALSPDRLQELLDAKGPSPLRTATRRATPPDALEAALNAVADGTWPRLARRVEPRIRQVPASVRRAFARDVLADAMLPPVTEALRAAGWTRASRWRTSVLTAPDGTTLDVGDTLTAALDSDDPAPVRALLAHQEAAV
ncbi:M48 family metallopeptidase [Streptomyces sp. NBC_00663]|uniref:M48 family metallopeptidase n=1 Tax=Streptomyces sp. NBC_00663 TaxID=2975801 RepID=UPI002E304112|nr:M48 family metallopeptidase [Streptomyces sp. NBC_00663]